MKLLLFLNVDLFIATFDYNFNGYLVCAPTQSPFDVVVLSDFGQNKCLL